MRLQSICALSVAVLAAVGHASAAETLDQQNDVNGSATADSAGPFSQEVGQTFTVGVVGTLSRIEAQLSRPGFSSGGTVILTVHNTSAGVPSASLCTAALPWDAIPTTGFGYQSFDVSSFAIPVHVNDVLAFGIKSSGDALFLLRSTFSMSTYAGGETMYRVLSSPPGPWTSFSPSHDSGFRTYVLSSPAGVQGDYNNDGTVDAADYVLWRKGGPLMNEVDTPGLVNGADYTAWRARFGNPGGAGAGVIVTATVPEPATLVLLMFAVAGWCLQRHRTA
jgi:PEP-CTERM motif